MAALNSERGNAAAILKAVRGPGESYSDVILTEFVA
jgi:hypothetical protein